MGSSYHDGERAVQERAGVVDMASRIARGIHSEIPSPAADFLAEQRFAVIGAARGDGSVWATIVAGEPGFLNAVSPSQLVIAGGVDDADPLAEVWASQAEIGLLAIDFAARKRMRINGQSQPAADGLGVRPVQVYANCPKYIRPRDVRVDLGGDDASHESASRTSGALGRAAQKFVQRSDTFFIASAVPGIGADVSHRGGDPGFVTVVDQHTILWPDYSGNTMFQTLGNIEAAKRAGLLFVDFESGDLLHVSGTARIIWDDPRIGAMAGAERLVELTVSAVVERQGAIRLRWSTSGRSASR